MNTLVDQLNKLSQAINYYAEALKEMQFAQDVQQHRFTPTEVRKVAQDILEDQIKLSSFKEQRSDILDDLEQLDEECQNYLHHLLNKSIA